MRPLRVSATRQYLWPAEEHGQSDGQPHSQDVDHPEPRALLRRHHQLSQDPRLFRRRGQSSAVNDQTSCRRRPTHLVSTGHQLLQPPAVRGPAVGHFLLRGDDEVVEVDVRGHGPQLQAQSFERRHPEGLQVLKVVGILDLTRLPNPLRGDVTE